MIVHVITQATEAYRGSTHADDFMLYHDALSQWWEKDAQDLIERLGFKDRQVRCLGATNSTFARYAGKLVGDSPELCRGLDSHGFADLLNAMDLNIALSCKMYPLGDKRRFETGTPAQMWETLRRCWQIAPTSERIIEDLSAFPRVLATIIERKGCAVPDEYLRSGRRSLKKDGTDAKLKARSRQRIDTQKAAPLHPDCAEARRTFLARFK